MRTKLGLLMGMILVISCISVSSNYAIDRDSIAGMWLFDEEQGNIAKDSSGKGNDGELLGNLEWVEGQIGGGISFPGTQGSFVNVPHNDSLTVAAFSICAWIKTPSGSADPRILVKGALANTYSYYLTLRSSLGVVFMGFHAKDSWLEAWGTANLLDDEWHHVAGVYDGKVMTLYLDGEIEAQEDHSGEPDAVDNPVSIGAESDGVLPFNGIIDDVGLFTVGLTQSEVRSIMTNGLETISPVSSAGKLAIAWGRVKVQ